MVNDKQVLLYRKHLSSGRYNREQAAVKSGMSAQTARKWESGPMPSEKEKTRDWRTRKDDFAEVWDQLILPELIEDDEGLFEATFLFEYLQEQHPVIFEYSKLRTFQRRVRDYRALHGPGQEVFFQQVHTPGKKAQLDFTRLKELGITINGEVFEKLLFECVLCYSGRRHVVLVPSESYEALALGVDGAFAAWNGVPAEMGHDHMSAAIHPIKREDRYEIHEQYRLRLAHYGVEPRFIEVAKPNQNGCVERAHGVLKNILRQALKLRRNSSFRSEAEFMIFLGLILERLHKKRALRWEEERKQLKPLPSSTLPSYSELKVSVSSWCLVQIKGNGYSVPSRLIDHEVTVRIHLDQLEVFYKDRLVQTMPRMIGRGRAQINYRHVIDSLVRKPGAFANYRYREELFPTLAFRQTYDAFLAWNTPRADLEYLRLLQLAARTMECDVDAALRLQLTEAARFGYRETAELVGYKVDRGPTSTVAQHPDLKSFDGLLSEGLRESLVLC